MAPPTPGWVSNRPRSGVFSLAGPGKCPGASEDLSQRGREEGGPLGAGSPRSAPDRTQVPGSHASQGFQWIPEMGI